MITIRSVGVQSAKVPQPLGSATALSTKISGVTNYRSGYLIVCPHPDTVPVYTEQVEDISSLWYPDATRWGHLRDRAVYHHSIDADWSISRWDLSKIPEPPPSYSDGYLLVGVTPQRFVASTLWGEDAKSVVIHTFEPLFHDVYGLGVVTPETVTCEIRFDGDFSYEYIHYSGYTITWASGLVETRTAFEGNPKLMQRFNNGTHYTFRYRLLSWVPAEQKWKTPDGKLYAYDDLPAELSQYAPWITYTQANYDLSQFTVESEENIQGQLASTLNVLKRTATWDLMSKIFLTPPETHPGQLGADILDQLRVVDANLLITAFELATLRLDSIPWKNFMALIREGKYAVSHGLKTQAQLEKAIDSSLKNGSGLMLGRDYGVMPTSSDAKELLEAFQNTGLLDALAFPKGRRFHARRQAVETSFLGSAIETETVLTVEADQLPRNFLSVMQMGIRTLHSFGLWPDFEMLWDFIPGSFVADWYLDIESLAESADTRIWNMYYPIWYCMISHKRLCTMSLQDLWPNLGLPSWAVTFRSYRRWCEKELPLPPISRNIENNPADHWIEAAALVIQRRR